MYSCICDFHRATWHLCDSVSQSSIEYNVIHYQWPITDEHFEAIIKVFIRWLVVDLGSYRSRSSNEILSRPAGHNLSSILIKNEMRKWNLSNYLFFISFNAALVWLHIRIFPFFAVYVHISSSFYSSSSHTMLKVEHSCAFVRASCSTSRTRLCFRAVTHCDLLPRYQCAFVKRGKSQGLKRFIDYRHCYRCSHS